MRDQDFIRHDPAVRWYNRSVVLYVLGMGGTLALGATCLGWVDWAPWMPLIAIGPLILALVSLGWFFRASTAAYAVTLLTDGPGNAPGMRAHQQLVTGKPPSGDVTAGDIRLLALVHLGIAGAALYYVYRSYVP